MDGLIINIDWPYFLGIVGVLIGISWYASSRFTKTETLLETIDRRLTNVEGRMSGAFQSQSPISLTVTGNKLLKDSGLQEYIDNNKDVFYSDCKLNNSLKNAYDVQEVVFNYFDNITFDSSFDFKLKEFSFQQGVDMAIIRRIGGIYLRNLFLEKLNMKEKDLDVGHSEQ